MKLTGAQLKHLCVKRDGGIQRYIPMGNTKSISQFFSNEVGRYCVIIIRHEKVVESNKTVF